MTVPVIGTSACIWCGEPVSLYKGGVYTKYCSRPKRCYQNDRDIIRSRNGFYSSSRRREVNKIAMRRKRLRKFIEVAIELYSIEKEKRWLRNSRVDQK